MAETTLGINGLQPGFKYNVRVRGIFNGTPGPWSPTEEFDVFSVTSGGTGDKAPSVPTAVTFVSTTVDSFILNWTAPTTNADSTTLTDMKDYVIEVSDDNFATGADATYFITEHQKPSDLTTIQRDRTFEFTFKMNKDLYTTPRAQLWFRVYARDTTNNRSTALSGTATNAAPSAPTSLTATAVVGGANVSWGGGTSNDIVAYTLKYSTSNGFDPTSTGTEAYRGPLTNYSFSGTTGTPYYFRVGSVDVFGQVAWYATQATATPLPTVTYNTPAAPTAFTNSYVGANYRIGWTASASAAVDVAKYRVEVTANSVTKNFYTTDVFLDIDPNMGRDFGSAWPYTPSTINVYTMGPSGLTSGALAGTGIVTAPATPTAPTLTSAIGTGGIAITWSAPSDPNKVIDEIQVYANTATTASPTNAVYAGQGTGFTYSISPIFNGTYYFKSRVLDIFGRFSGYSAEDTEVVTSIGVPTALSTSSALDPADSVNSTSIITVNWTNPSTITFNGAKVRYRITGGLWTEVDVGSMGGAGAAASYNLRNLVPGSSYIVEVAAYDFKGSLGTWTAAGTQVAASDSTGPVSTLSPTTSSGSTSILVSWTGVDTTTNPGDKDAVFGNGRYDIEIATNTIFSTGVIKQSMPTGASAAAFSASFTGLTAGTTYYARVRAVDWTGNAGSWNVYGGGTPTATVVGAAGISYSTPNNASAITDGWVGANYRISWTAATGTATDILKYKIDVLANAVTKTFYTTGLAIEIDPASGKSFGTAWPYTPTSITVTTIGPSGLQSTGVVKNSAFTAAPSTPTAPTLTSTFGTQGIALTWSAPSDPNAIIDQIEVYANTASTASPTNAVYSGVGTGFTYSVSPLFNGTYYFKSRVLDKFGRYSSYSAEDTEALVSVGVPSAMSLTPSLDPADPTNRTSMMAVAFTIANTAVYGGTRLRYRIGAGAWTEIDLGAMGTAGSAVTYNLRNLTPGAIYIVDLAHYTFNRSLGVWTNAGTQTATADSTAPVSSLSPTATASTTAVAVNWTGVNTGTNPGDADAVNGYGRYDIEIATDNVFSTGVIKKSMTTGASAAAMSTAFAGLTAGTTYYTRVRAVDATGNLGTWNVYGGGTPTSVTVGSVTPSYSTPTAPTSLVDSWVGANYRVSWTASTTPAVTDIDRYRVEVTANSVTKSYFTDGTYIDIDPQQGKDYGTAWPYTPTLINVYAIGPSGLTSTALAKSSAFAAAPSTPTAPTLTSTIGTGGVAITWSAPSDPNGILDQIEIYAGTAASPTNMAYAGKGTSFTFGVSPMYSGTYYFRSRVRDVFGRFSSYSADDTEAVTTVGAPTSVTVNGGALDPADPTKRSAMVNVNWTTPNNISYAGTKIRYRIDAGTNTEVNVGKMGAPNTAVTYTLRNLTPGSAYTVELICYDFNGTLGNSGTWTAASGSPITVAKDTGLPATPTTCTVASNTQNIQVTQPSTANDADGDVRHYNVYASTSNGFTPGAANLIGQIQYSPGVSAIATFQVPTSGGGSTQSWYVRTKAVDWNGNESATASTQVAATPGLINTANITDAAITNAKINDLDAAKITAGTVSSAKFYSGVLASNLLVNPAFEQVGSGSVSAGTYGDNESFPGWTFGRTSPDATSAYGVEYLTGGVTPRAGLAKLRLDCIASQAGTYAVSDPIPVVVGVTYRIGGYVSGDANARITMAVETAGSSTGPWTEQALYTSFTPTTGYDIPCVITDSGDQILVNGGEIKTYNCDFDATNDLVVIDDQDGNSYVDGDVIMFNTIVTTTGISTNTKYYVVNSTDSDFQVATTEGGSPLALTNAGTGTVTLLNCTIDAAGDLIKFKDGHNFSNGDAFAFKTILSTTGASVNTRYYVINKTSTTLQISTTVGGAAVALTTDGFGTTFTKPHPFMNGDPIMFKTITTTTGISTNTRYYVVGATATTLQVASTVGGAAIALTNNGTATLYAKPNLSAADKLQSDYTTTSGQTWIRVKFKNVGSAITSSAYVDDAWFMQNGYGTVELTGAGLRMWDKTGEETISLLGEPVGGGSFLQIRNNGEAMANIGSDGVANFQKVETEAIEIQGLPLSDFINAGGKGVVAFGGRNTDSNLIGTGEDPYLEIQAELEKGRTYRIMTSQITLGNPGSGNSSTINIRYTTNGSRPTNTDTILCRARGGYTVSGTAGRPVVNLQRIYRLASGKGKEDFRATIFHTGSAASSSQILGTIDPIQIWIEDIGPYIEDIGIDRGTNSTDDNWKVYTKTYNCQWSSFYDSSGNKIDGKNDVIGHLNINGIDLKSAFGFDSSKIQSDLTGATVLDVDLYMYCFGTWDNKGATAVIGEHESGSEPNDWTNLTNKNSDLKRVSDWRPGTGKWVDLGDASFPYSAWKNGGIKGIILGPSPTQASRYSMYLRGVAHPKKPVLRIKYKKQA